MPDPSPALGSGGDLRILLVAARRATPAGAAAYSIACNLHAALRAQRGIAAFLLTEPDPDFAAPLGTVLHQPWDDDSTFALDAGDCDPLGHRGIHPCLPRSFAALLQMLSPDIVDFHGLPWFGVDAFAVVRRTLPLARILLTIDTEAAAEAGLAAPRPGAGEAFLRHLLLARFLAELDGLVARGPMLAEACVSAKLPVPRILVIPPGHDAPAIPAPVPGRRLILGCFAEGLDTEGTEVLLEAAAVLRAWPATARAIRIELHGEASGLARAGVEAVGAPLLRCTGLPGRDVEAALRGCHSVIIPGGSQADAPAIAVRALAHGRPVLCADAGGTARLVRDGRDGFHFPAQSGAALADLLDDLAAAPDRLAALRPDRDALQSLSSMRETTIGLYRSLLAGTA